jgi:hypothetical protein
MTENAEIRNVIPPYYGFIIDKLNRIFYLWDEAQNEALALRCALRLTKFLPRKLKNQLREETDKIKTELEIASKGIGYNFQTANRNINQSLAIVAHKYLENYVNKLTDLLDQEHMLTQSYGIPTRSRGMGDIQRTVDQARYNTET